MQDRINNKNRPTNITTNTVVQMSTQKKEKILEREVQKTENPPTYISEKRKKRDRYISFIFFAWFHSITSCFDSVIFPILR